MQAAQPQEGNDGEEAQYDANEETECGTEVPSLRRSKTKGARVGKAQKEVIMSYFTSGDYALWCQGSDSPPFRLKPPAQGTPMYPNIRFKVKENVKANAVCSSRPRTMCCMCGSVAHFTRLLAWLVLQIVMSKIVQQCLAFPKLKGDMTATQLLGCVKTSYVTARNRISKVNNRGQDQINEQKLNRLFHGRRTAVS